MSDVFPKFQSALSYILALACFSPTTIAVANTDVSAYDCENPEAELRKAHKWSQAQCEVEVEKLTKEFWCKSFAGIKADPKTSAGVDTWCTKSELKSLNVLSQRRTRQRQQNLYNPYGDEFPKADFECSEKDVRFRSDDGRCNDLEFPNAGRTGMRFLRLVPLDKAVGETGAELVTPNPREISLSLLGRDHGFKPAPFVNLFAAAWIQFQIHDWFDHGENDPAIERAIRLPLPELDPLRLLNGLREMIIPATRLPFLRADGSDRNNPSVITDNQVTSWWDLSTIYGSNIETQHRVRAMKDGKLKVDELNRLPLSKYNFGGHAMQLEQTGFNRNWWLGLSLLHHLFTWEHNLIADKLKLIPETAQKLTESDAEFDDRIFQQARLINTFVQAKIHTVEWTPAILASPLLYKSMTGNMFGLGRDKGEFKVPMEKVFRLFLDWSGNRGVAGRVGEKPTRFGLPFGHGQEFVSVYRMHPLMPDSVAIQNWRTGNSSRAQGERSTTPLTELRDTGSSQKLYVPGRGLQAQDDQTNRFLDLFYSFGTQNPGNLVLNNYPKFMQEFSVPGPNGSRMHMDLAAIDILRDRERGVPRYNEFRELFGMRPVPDFRFLTPNKKVVAELRRLYNNDISKLDLFVGAMAEGSDAPQYRPPGFGFSDTLFNVFILTASRRLETDRFFTTAVKDKKTAENYYTKFGYAWARDRSFSAMILDHMPELSPLISGIENPFRPWHKANDVFGGRK